MELIRQNNFLLGNYDEIVTFAQNLNCLKGVRIWRFSGQYFPVFGLNTEIYSENLHIHSDVEK